MEWKGKDGHLEFYDKAKKEAVNIPLPFKFILLDRTATVRGYNNRLKSGIYSNEVRDTRSDRLVVKLFSGGIVAEGVWADIKDKVTARGVGGVFATNCYIAFMHGTELKLGAIQMTGCSLSPWFDFEKEYRAQVQDPSNPGKTIQELFARAVVMNRGVLNTSGDIHFVPPVFSLVDIKPETNAKAIELDRRLQLYLDGYFKRTTIQRVETPADEPTTHRQPAGASKPQEDVCPTCSQPMPEDGSPCPACSGGDVPF
jgi:hypothetical protein